MASDPQWSRGRVVLRGSVSEAFCSAFGWSCRTREFLCDSQSVSCLSSDAKVTAGRDESLVFVTLHLVRAH